MLSGTTAFSSAMWITIAMSSQYCNSSRSCSGSGNCNPWVYILRRFISTSKFYLIYIVLKKISIEVIYLLCPFIILAVSLYNTWYLLPNRYLSCLGFRTHSFISLPCHLCRVSRQHTRGSAYLSYVPLTDTSLLSCRTQISTGAPPLNT